MSSARWSSSVAAYFAVVGASVGLGSIWRFPYLAGTYGGGAFVLAFILICLAIAVPLLAAEFLIGRYARSSPHTAAGRLAAGTGGTQGSVWNLIGVLGTLAAFLIMTYYTVIAGWVLAYTWICATGQLTGLNHEEVRTLWQHFLADPWQLSGWALAFVVLVGSISALGVTRGLERASRLRAPALLVLLLVLVGYALLQGDVRRGLSFALTPDFNALRSAVWLAATGQAFYATGVGMAMMLAYGSYLDRDTLVIRSALIVCGGILVVSLLATLLIFPLVFRYHMNPAQGPDLVFDVLATVFADLPGGRLVGSMFFLLLVLAALTPTLAALEPTVLWLQERFELSRAVATALTYSAVWVLGWASNLSFNRWAGWRPLKGLPGFASRTLFASIDYVSSNWMLPLGALLTSVFVGWFAQRSTVFEELSGSHPTDHRICLFLLKYVCPLVIGTLFLCTL